MLEVIYRPSAELELRYAYRRFQNSMPEKNKEPRRPILTRKEQTLLAFLLALLILGGIVRKLRMDWSMASVPVHKS